MIHIRLNKQDQTCLPMSVTVYNHYANTEDILKVVTLVIIVTPVTVVTLNKKQHVCKTLQHSLSEKGIIEDSVAKVSNKCKLFYSIYCFSCLAPKTLLHLHTPALILQTFSCALCNLPILLFRSPLCQEPQKTAQHSTAMFCTAQFSTA